jgi:hypothetical protein
MKRLRTSISAKFKLFAIDDCERSYLAAAPAIAVVTKTKATKMPTRMEV